MNGMVSGRYLRSVLESLLHQIDIAGESEEPAWGADGFLPDSPDNIEYDVGAVERLRMMKTTACLVYLAMRVAVAAMLVAYNKSETITMHPIKLKSASRWHACIHMLSFLLIVARGDRHGQGKDLGVLPGTDQLQPA